MLRTAGGLKERHQLLSWAEDCGGFKKVEWSRVYLLELGTQLVGVVWVTWVCEGPALRGTGVTDGRVGSGWLWV